ncbi:ribonuclease P protein component [Marmoricola sp. OAE513]|uniref:ribonuclease P protein component n=1 Tax=Marmoricola sp. OAE513 TaxID=2817894 RepID=UPI001AE6D7C8
MLPSRNRLTDGADFRLVVRRGRRSGGSLMVVHLLVPNVDKATESPPQVGFVVAKAVGPAVTRNRVKRRLRHLMRERVTSLPSGSMLVVRALPAAAGATFGDLAAELDRCLQREAARVTSR